mmetsp:Transcript_26160/g.75440  ORF Transcript_26160/g.75440 Transcript_26160/m.75440 type:complete len:228 (-) Transcript_26160:287-970(-)
MASPRGVSSAASTSASSDSYQDAVVKARPTKLFVGGIGKHTTTKQLREHFSRYGQVMDCIAMRGPNGKARGFGYVTLDTPDAANSCLSEAQHIDGRVVEVKHVVPLARPRKKGAAMCPKCCAECGSTFSRCSTGSPPEIEKNWSSGGGWSRTSPATGGWPANSWSWNSSWGVDDCAGAVYSYSAPPTPPAALAPPPGLPQPRGMSLFRTPSPSECSSRSSSPARSEA